MLYAVRPRLGFLIGYGGFGLCLRYTETQGYRHTTCNSSVLMQTAVPGVTSFSVCHISLATSFRWIQAAGTLL